MKLLRAGVSIWVSGIRTSATPTPIAPASGGEVSGVVPGPGPTYASRAGILARRTAPLAALVAVFLFQTILNVDTVVVFPLYLGAVLMGAILEERLESFAVAGVAVLAL